MISQTQVDMLPVSSWLVKPMAIYDAFNRPQQVTHLDDTSEQTYYACCGVDATIDRDGLVTQYLYDSAKRQVAYQKIFNGNPITYSNMLDAAGNVLESIRIGRTIRKLSRASRSMTSLAGWSRRPTP